jgi:hypothetical protein
MRSPKIMKFPRLWVNLCVRLVINYSKTTESAKLTLLGGVIVSKLLKTIRNGCGEFSQMLLSLRSCKK